ncbi:SWIM zinc finger family protein [Bacillus sp. FJAT-49736]|uniref:SWIM zinc finger family protein n=1 Tax=Bacillus sp. FJAT-49736 TaxID=2833582 RepID=UPI001BC96CA4|nr:SWIM zinc finger family protein [Bacillus sp. FJAT-49736]MBS4175450.1 SWIM zinc finger family protein [Bacillus sp. FJAT-49736]
MKEELQAFAEKLQSYLDPASDTHQKLVQKGLLLYRQQLVSKKNISQNIISAKVQDVTPVQVSLDLENPENSSCSCPQEGICRHQMALFFSVYNQIGSVFDWVQEWKKHDSSFAILKNMRRGSDLVSEQTPVPLSGHEAWIHRFHKAFNNLDIQNEYVLEEKLRVTYNRLIEYAPVEREWRPLYHLFAAYHTLKEANEICVRNHFQTHEAFFSFMLEEADDALKKLSISVLPFAFDSYIAYLREDCTTLLNTKTFHSSELAELYMLLWTSLFKQTIWRKLELERLQSETIQNERMILAKIYLSILCGKDEIALSAMKTLDKNIIYFSQYWFQYLKTQKAYSRLIKYIHAMIPFISDYLSKLKNDFDSYAFMRMFFRTIDENMLADHHPLLLERIYIEFLPFSYTQYNEYLIVKQKFRTWVELQHLTGRDIELVDKYKLETVAKTEPQLVMPLYHAAVEHLLESRTRDAYKRSVRYLKKLRALYKKQKKLNAWDIYFDDLLLKTKRLRAFHEECRRGKLIDA